MLELRTEGEQTEMNELFLKVYEEMKAVPITMMFMAGLYALVGLLLFDHVSKRDFEELKSQLSSVRYTLQRDHADTRLHTIEQEIFSLTQHVNDERKKDHPVDPLYDERINDLQHQHEQALRELSALDQVNRLGSRNDAGG